MIEQRNREQQPENGIKKIKNQKRERILKILLVILCGILFFGLIVYAFLYLFDSKNDYGFKNYVNIEKKNVVNEEKKEVINENTNLVVNEVKPVQPVLDITSDWLEFNVQGISFLYPEVLESTRKVREIESFSGDKYDFYDFGVFGIGVIDNLENLSLKDVIKKEYDPDNLLANNDFIVTKIGKNNQISALSVNIVDEEKADEYFEKYGPIGIKYFILGNGKVYTISGGQAFPNKEVEDYYIKNNLKNVDDMVKTIEVK